MRSGTRQETACSGIDRRAIVLSGREDSLRFYSNSLGMVVSGESENYGPEKGRLNSVLGAKMRLTELRAQTGPVTEVFATFIFPAGATPGAFGAMPRTLFRGDWMVFAERPFGGAEHALRYLGCCTHRVAISNHRLMALEDGEVVFQWRDLAHKNKKRLMRLPLDEFLRRFLLHVLPGGFVRIRHFGFFVHRRRRWFPAT